MANLCVFCGSSSGSRPSFRLAAEQVGSELAAREHRLVYGGGDVGLMGVVADAVMSGGGQVTGVITEQLQDLELGHGGITDLEIAVDMHERKARMAALSDGVIVLPGGFGTLDEMFEILTWNQLGIISVPVVLFDVDGYFDSLFSFVADVVAAGFMRPDHGSLMQRARSAAETVERAAAAPHAYIPKWVG